MDDFKSSYNFSNPNDTFVVKQATKFGQYSTLILALNKRTKKHLTFQTILSSVKSDIIEQLKAVAAIDANKLVKYDSYIEQKSDNMVTWLIFEECFCNLSEYCKIFKTTLLPIDDYFINGQKGWIDRIYDIDKDKYSFDLKLINLEYIRQLFSIINHFNDKDINEYISLNNIYINIKGNLKLFLDLPLKVNVNKDVEDIALENKIELEKELFLDHDVFNQYYLRNVFNVALLSIELIYRNWSPFRDHDISREAKSLYHLNNKNKFSWLIRTIYDDEINKNYIEKGILNSVKENDEKVKLIVEILLSIMKPRNLRINDKYWSQTNQQLSMDDFIEHSDNTNTNLDLLAQYLTGYYLDLLKDKPGKASNYLRKINKSVKFGELKKRKRSHYKIEDCQYQNISNWKEDLCYEFPTKLDNNSYKYSQSFNNCNDTFFDNNSEYTCNTNAVCYEENVKEDKSLFPVLKTKNDGSYLQYFAKKSKTMKILSNSVPKPVIISYPEGNSTLYYQLNDSTELILKGVPSKELAIDLDYSADNTTNDDGNEISVNDNDSSLDCGDDDSTFLFVSPHKNNCDD